MSGLALEQLVSSKIRLRLLTHLLTHPDDRVYLRGVAKSLELPISPTRRELQRLVAAGLLKTTQEGLLKYYWVDRQSPEFPRLLRLIQEQAPSAAPVAAPSSPVQSPVSPAQTVPAQAAVARGPIELVAVPVKRQSVWLRWALGLSSIAFLATFALLVYVLRHNISLMDLAERAMSRTVAAQEHALAVPAAAGSHELESARWRVMPGSWGGYAPATAGTNAVKETY